MLSQPSRESTAGALWNAQALALSGFHLPPCPKIVRKTNRGLKHNWHQA